MKKITFVSLVSFAFLLFASFITWILEQFHFQSAVPLLMTGVVIFLVSAAIAYFSEKSISLNILCLFISGIALGFCIASWYTFRGFHNSLLVMCLTSLVSVTYLWVFYFVFKIPFIRRHFGVFFWIYLILSLILYIFVIIATETTYVSTYGYYMIIEIAFIYTLCTRSVDTRSVLREAALSTFSVLVVAALIALLMLALQSDDIDADGFDIDGDFKGIAPQSHSADKRMQKPPRDYHDK